MDSKEQVINKLKNLTGKDNILFMDKCRDAAELLMILAKKQGFENVILQEEGGWYTYEKSAMRQNLNVLFAQMNNGILLKEKFPFNKKALIIINTNPGYAYIDELSFYDELKKNGSIIVNDVVSSIGEDYSKKGDFIIGSFGKNKPLSISSGGAFIAFNDVSELEDLKEEFYQGAGTKIDFDELTCALDIFREKKLEWINFASNIKDELKQKGFKVLNINKSINIFVEKDLRTESLIKFCQEHNLEFTDCPLYIRTIKDAISIEIKKTNWRDIGGIKRT